MNMAVKIRKTKAEQEYSELFETHADTLPGDQFVLDQRKQAIATFDELGLPNRRVEEWKYSDIRAFVEEAYKPAVPDDTDLSENDLREALGSFSQLDCYRIIFVNGHYRLDKFGYGDGIDVQNLNDVFTESPAWISEHLGQAVPFPKKDATLALNTAFMADGITIRISKNIEKPVHVVYIDRGESSHASTVRNIITLQDGSSATIIEQYVTLGDTSYQANIVTEAFIADGAELNHIKVQNNNASSSHLSTWTAKLGKEAQYNPFHLTAGSAFSRDQLHVRFDGEDSKLNFGAVYLGRDRQHGDTTLVVDHAVPNCESRELYKGVMGDQARGVFQGMLMVRQIAQKTDGKQMAQALLLSEEAEFDAKPELEIFADDVVCGHGATSGQIDEELLFYLLARGIPRDQAKALLIQAFTGEALELIENENIRECLADLVVGWLDGAKSEA